MDHRYFRIAIASAAACASAAVLCHGKVFLRSGSDSGASSPAPAGDERSAGTSDVDVRGGTARLQVSVIDARFGEFVSRLRATAFAGRESSLVVVGGLASGTILEGKRVLRLLVSELDGRCLLFRLEQSNEEYERSLRQQASIRLKSLPVYPGSVPLFSAGNADTGTSLEVSGVDADAAAVREFVDSGLRKAGWFGQRSSAPPAGDGAWSCFYVRGRDLCCVLVRPRAENAAGSIVSMLIHQRKRGTETE